MPDTSRLSDYVSGRLAYGAHEAVTVAGSSIGLTAASFPSALKLVYIFVEDGVVRWRADGTAPTAAIGTPAYPGDEIILTTTKEALNFRAIRKSTSSGVLQVTYYSEPSGAGN